MDEPQDQPQGPLRPILIRENSTSIVTSLGKCLSTRVRNLTDVGVDVFAKWGVVPEDVVALSVSPFSSCSRFVV